MVTDAASSVAAKERVSTAATTVIGYSADDVASAFDSLFRNKTDVAGSVRLMDEYRIGEAKAQGFESFSE